VCSHHTYATCFTSFFETQLNVATGFAVTAQCADNYQGAATVDACTSSGPYSLIGCSAIVCSQPTDTTGYTVTETQLNVATGFAVTAQCADNYQGDATVDACTSSAPYSLTGCSAIVCSQPIDTTGFTSIVETQLNVATGFAVTAQCADNYQGNATVDACTSSGPYSLTGCTLAPPHDSGGVGIVVAIVIVVVLAGAAVLWLFVSRKRPDNGAKETMKTVQTYTGNEEKITIEDNMP
jgi:hypothetical protein